MKWMEESLERFETFGKDKMKIFKKISLQGNFSLS